MKKKIGIIVLIVISIMMLIGIGYNVYAKYVLSKRVSISFDTSDYYFDVELDKTEVNLLPATVNVTVKNYEGTSFTDTDLTYNLSASNPYLDIVISENTGTLTGGSKQEKSFQITLNSNAETELFENIDLNFDISKPYKDTKKVTLKVNENEVNVKIPEGFYYVGGVKRTGVVISDNKEDENKGTSHEVASQLKGNQFVWIPVDGTNLKYEKHTYSTAGQDDTASITTDANGWKTYYYTNYSDWTDNGGNVESVNKYGGFYIARYEAGLPISKTEGSTYNTTSEKNVDNLVPVSKMGVAVWNFISQENAVKVAKKMYEGSTSVTSSLVDSYAWDSTTQWLQNSGYNVTDSTSWGNYYDAEFDLNGLYAIHLYNSGSGWTYASTYSLGSHTKASSERTEISTGIVERNKAKNIYDFAGNMYEWTSEIGRAGNFAVLRGGCFGDFGAGCPCCYRYGNYTTQGVDNFIGYRVVLYMK